ncbi:MAG: glycosyltransferase family 2 protein [Gaiellales bacterium]|nr:glycosyltransferase family 2 protein [Gaiellales bacterium]
MGSFDHGGGDAFVEARERALVDVVIVAHNSGSLLEEAVASAVAEAGADHVWVVDAGSTDGSVAAVHARGFGVRVLHTGNFGFAAANNLGIAATEAPYVLLLNPDAVLSRGGLDKLMWTAESDPRAGIVGPLVLNPDGSVQADSFGRFPSLVTTLKAYAWRLRERRQGNRALSPPAPTSTQQVDWVTGACMLVRRAAIEDAGPMDEGFFLYYEDVDWCLRLREQGWKVLLAPGARVTHYLGRSQATGSTRSVAARASFCRYCDLHGLWGLKLLSRCKLALRRVGGGLS